MPAKRRLLLISRRRILRRQRRENSLRAAQLRNESGYVVRSRVVQRLLMHSVQIRGLEPCRQRLVRTAQQELLNAGLRLPHTRSSEHSNRRDSDSDTAPGCSIF